MSTDQPITVPAAPARLKVAAIVPVFNEEHVIGSVIDAIPRDLVDTVIAIDDGSTDSTPAELAKRDVIVLRHDKQQYIGVAIRDGLEHAKSLGIDVICVFAGNGKDDPRQIPLLLEPILSQGYDYVQGSRYLEGGEYGKMPLHRTVVTRVYPWLLWLISGFRATDATNGFRAYRLSLLDDPRINLHQDWLDECLEYYFSLRVCMLKYRVTEVPVKKLYPPTNIYKKYTKVRPGIGWLNRLKPLVYLGLRLKR